MVWARIDDSILDNIKIQKVGVNGFAMHVAAITWCARTLSDGFVPEVRIDLLLPLDRTAVTNTVDMLVYVGLWEKVPGGYQIHD